MGMPRRVTGAQVKELRRQLNQGASLRKAALKANMDRKSARKYRDLGVLPDEARKRHTWRTRGDPLASVWTELEALLQGQPDLQAVTLLGWLQSTYPGMYADSVRRTLERRVRTWKAQHGPAKEIFFAQVHEPGRLGASDFTHMNDLRVTIAYQRFDHLVYHFVLTHSNWEHVTVCCSESFASLSTGMQNALWALGAVPQRHRTDRMTLAVHHDGHAEQFTDKYRALLAHYGVQAEATNPYSGNENGDVESSHGHFKTAAEQALLLRGSRDFASRPEYEQWLRALAVARNAGRAAKVTAEMPHLQALPAGRLETLERLRVRVSRGSTIRVKSNTYSVPARLRGEQVEARVGMETIEV
jgi:transposase